MAPLIGESPVPTRFRIEVKGTGAFVRCGADILLNGLQQNLEAEARCPTCDQAIRFTIHRRRVEGLEPAGALLHVVEVPWEPGFILCEATQIFDRDECQRRWSEGYAGPGGELVSLQGYLDRCSYRFSRTEGEPWGP